MSNPAPVNFDDFTENYNALLARSTKFFTPSEEYFASYKVQILKRETESLQIDRILEYGCGIGRNLPFLRSAFPQACIEACDISPKSQEVAKENNPHVEFYVESDLVKQERQYDLVFVAGVFHHVPVEDRRNLVKKIFFRCSPGGWVFIFEHNPWNPVTRKIVHDCEFDQDAVLLRPTELLSLVSWAGFVQPKHRYCLFMPPHLKLLARIEKFFGKIPLGGQFWVNALRKK